MGQVRKGYGQFCPIAKAVEVLGERWSMLIVRDMLVGSRRFNELARGLPGLSRSLLAQRLRQLQAAGVVTRDGTDYVLTPAGLDLEPIVFGLGAWGARWAFGPPDEEDLDPELLIWWVHGRIDTSVLPERRVVIAVHLSEPHFWAWLVIDQAGASVCTTDPGFECDASIEATTGTLSEVWLGRRPLAAAMKDGSVRVTGRPDVTRLVPAALQLSPVAGLVAQAR